MSFIEMRNITKVYPNGVIANNNASLSINKGEIHAVAGENGAGKSTILKILYGAEKAEGEIFIDGKRVEINSPKVANSLGIGMVYQHFMLVNEFSAWENIYFGIEETNKLGVLNKKLMKEKVKDLIVKYDMPIDLDEKCGDMSVSTAQKVEILKVLARGTNVIILDEPTAVLTPQETEQLFKQLRLLKKSGYTIIIITHILKEIKALCDRITIMRQGETVGTYKVKDVSEEKISELMVGRKIINDLPRKKLHKGEVALTVKNLTVKGKGDKLAVNNVSFNVVKGEILCFAGIEGNGQRETINAITGSLKNYEGKILIGKQDIKKLTVKKIREKGLCHIPEDRLRTGCDKDGTIYENLISLDYKNNCTAGFLNEKYLKNRGNKEIKKYLIKGDLNTKIGMLSGGNIQKVIIARELESNADLIIANQPTRGVDVGAIEYIHKQLIKMRDEGKAIVLVSADLSEVFNLADRIMVFHDGKITANFTDVKSINEMELGKYMLGIKSMKVEG